MEWGWKGVGGGRSVGEGAGEEGLEGMAKEGLEGRQGGEREMEGRRRRRVEEE